MQCFDFWRRLTRLVETQVSNLLCCRGKCFAAFVVITSFSIQADTGLHRVTPPNVKMPLVPGIATEYTVERAAFPGVVFENPVAIVSAPGEANRLYIVERAG